MSDEGLACLVEFVGFNLFSEGAEALGGFDPCEGDVGGEVLLGNGKARQV